MKNFIKKVSISLCFVCLLSTISIAGEAFDLISAYSTITNIQIQNKNYTPVATLFYDHETYIPLDLLNENLHCSTFIDEKTNTIQLKNDLSFQDFSETNPLKGETFVYGEIIQINKDQNIFTVEQSFDDNSLYVEPNIHVSRDAIIILERNDKKMNIEFDDLRIGDFVGVTLNKKGIARGILLTY